MAKEAKDKVTPLEILKIVAPWLSLPIGTLILALVPEVRNHIWPATPKGLLLALLIVSLSVILGLVPYALRLRRKHQTLSTALDYWKPTAEARETAASKAQTEHGILNAHLNAQLVEANAKIQSLERQIEDLTHIEVHKTFKTVALIESFRNNLPKRELKMSDVSEYHSLLREAEKELQYDLAAFRIPSTAFESREIPTSVSFDAFGHPSSDRFPVEQFCRIEPFKRKIDALLVFLAQKKL
jgi:hypothetical protein